jgi:flavin reductase (DIM6/NTAB) family NADH-FMN oxidoreductase RutF
VIHPNDFRNTLGRFASGVTVVTTKTDQGIHGITVSAFISVSLTPPLIAVCIDKKARTHELLEGAHTFGVSILKEGQEPISNHFAGRGEDTEVTFEMLADIPVLTDVLAQIACHKVAAHDAGDHTLFIGQIQALGFQDARPLVYFSGKYRQITE